MAHLWRRTLDHLFPDVPDEGEPTHTEKVDEARQAVRTSKQQLAEVGKLSATVERAADHSRKIRNRNHFSEMVAAMLREEK
jgi:hypothetical protein